MLPRFGSGQGNGKKRVNGNSCYAQFFPRHADVRQVFRRFLDRHVVAIHRAAQPHGVDVIVGDHDGVMRREFFLGDQPSDNFRRQEVRRHAKIRLDTFEQTDHGPGV